VQKSWSYPVRKNSTGRPTVIELHDGDTFKLLLDAGCDTGVFAWLRVAAGCAGHHRRVERPAGAAVP
jgi:hypothetical protein